MGTPFQMGKGTPITIHLPLTLSVLQAVVMRLGSASYTVPTVMAEQVQRPKANVLVATRSAMTVEWQVVTDPPQSARHAARHDGDRKSTRLNSSH